MEILNTLSFILRHPLNRGRPLRAASRFVRWQLGSRLVSGPVAVPFVDKTRLLVLPGMTGATGNIYCGLHEFEDMSLVLHALRAGDLFIDIGANVGSYTVIAGGACGARVIAIEPMPLTFARLVDNIRLNNLANLVRAENIGLGAKNDLLRFSKNLDTINHVLSEAEIGSVESVEIRVKPLDAVLENLAPTLIKMDVEGFETEVVAGAAATLVHPGLLAVLMELNGSGARYGYDETKLHRQMLEFGFAPFRYEPFSREFFPRHDATTDSGNTLYVRDIAKLRERVLSAPAHDVQGTAL